jgi:hypothetical protein
MFRNKTLILESELHGNVYMFKLLCKFIQNLKT